MSYSRVGLAYNRRMKGGLYVLCLFLFSFVILVHVCKTLVIPLLHCMTCRGGLHCCAQCSLMFELFFFFSLACAKCVREGALVFTPQSRTLLYTSSNGPQGAHNFLSLWVCLMCSSFFLFAVVAFFYSAQKIFGAVPGVFK